LKLFELEKVFKMKDERQKVKENDIISEWYSLA
jgi:hypothetical protein